MLEFLPLHPNVLAVFTPTERMLKIIEVSLDAFRFVFINGQKVWNDMFQTFPDFGRGFHRLFFFSSLERFGKYFLV